MRSGSSPTDPGVPGDARGQAIGEAGAVYGLFLSGRYAPLAPKLINFTTLIEEKTRHFVGRHFVFDALDDFLRRSPSGYFIIKGEPGIGKSALMAQLVKTRGYVHHFVVSTQGLNRADQFLENICAQLIACFDLDRPARLPMETTRGSAFLSTLLREVSDKLARGERAVLLVDALDEVDWPPGARENVLYLPPTLPGNVFFVVTTRHREDLPLQVDAPHTFYLEPDSPANREDVLAYVTCFARREALQARLAAWGVSVETFARRLLVKSEGNFMYLHFVLPAIKAGRFVHGTLDELPQGLKGYYERHWLRMRAVDEDAWVNYRQAVICYLAAAREPVSVWQIASWSGLSPARVLTAIREWREFLDEETVGGEKRYRIYHASFQDFLAAKDEAREINLKRKHADIADEGLRQWDATRGGAVSGSPSRHVPGLDYVRGLQQLQILVEQRAPDLVEAFHTLEARLLDNLSTEEKYGSTETTRADRARIIDALNNLARRAGLPQSFNDLCRGT